MPSSARKQAQCSQLTMRVLDFAALALVALAAALLFLAPGLEGEGHVGDWRSLDLGFAVAGGTVMIIALAASVARRRLDGDEYARQLVGQAAGIGFFAAMTGFVVWRPLAESWVAAPTGDQMMAMLFAGTGLGYFVARARGNW